MRVLIFLAALLVAPAWADDELIPDPETLAVAPYEDGDGYVLLTFRAVTGVEGLTGYRIYHEILISFDADSTGRLVPTEPYLAWLVWGRVDAIPGADIMRVVMAVLDEDVQRFGVSSEAVVDGMARTSTIIPFPSPQDARTAVVGTSWARVKTVGR
ncbi:MAG: hypothetical protein VCF24_08430 [Candidatus Latescibacterota bacterium]|jgi:hypothetical protein